VTGRVSNRPRPADLHRQRIAAQPWLGVGGLLLGAAVFFALALGAGSTQISLLVLRNLAHWPPDAISAACGCIISATLIVAMLFEGWPAARLPPAWLLLPFACSLPLPAQAPAAGIQLDQGTHHRPFG
jgi:hypothetical protein